jgi:anaerobic magnesium-protoporphyrin IX monomethyl ester cyclase
MSKVLLVNPNYYDQIFGRASVRAAISRSVMPLGLVTVAAPLLRAGHDVRILDLNLVDGSARELESALREFEPDLVGITATTPLIASAYKLAATIKTHRSDLPVIAGGAHPSALPMEVLTESVFDGVVQGEGDLTLLEILEQGADAALPGYYYKTSGVVAAPPEPRAPAVLDDLPFPAYEMLDIQRYRQPRIMTRRTPVGYMETSRGCYGRCVYCNKNINGYKLRFKSPERVVDQIEHMLNLGFAEVQITDDIFTADMDRAAKVCEEILRRGLKFPWYPRGGLRVDRVNLELLKLMKRAGCYRIPFGVESGSQRILDSIKKGITVEQAQSAVKAARQAGLETECYFMIGLPGEDESDIQKSMALAIDLDPDYAKFALTIPLPGTPMFSKIEEEGRLLTRDWSKYTFSTPPGEIYRHDTLPAEVMARYANIAQRRFYFRTGHVLRLVAGSLKQGTFFAHLKAFFQTKW